MGVAARAAMPVVVTIKTVTVLNTAEEAVLVREALQPITAAPVYSVLAAVVVDNPMLGVL